MKNFFKNTFNFFVYVFAIIGFGLTGMYFAVKFHLTDDKGIVDNQRSFFLENASAQNTTKNKNILEIHADANKASAIDAMINPNENWENSPEWQIVKDALVKDKDVIYKVSYNLDIAPRFVVMPVIAEQMRYFNTDRELFKRVFAPLKILGNLTQFSWGVSGIKEATAIQIENNLKNKNSPYYLGENFEHLLDFKTLDISQERFARITDKHNRYYAYLYAAIYEKQIMRQWAGSGYPLDDKPGVIATLYNIGFQHSDPNPNPQLGGTAISIGGKLYSFGSLGESFYYSSELLTEFPRSLGASQ